MDLKAEVDKIHQDHSKNLEVYQQKIKGLKEYFKIPKDNKAMQTDPIPRGSNSSESKFIAYKIPRLKQTNRASESSMENDQISPGKEIQDSLKGEGLIAQLFDNNLRKISEISEIKVNRKPGIECDEKYKDFDEIVISYLEQKYGDSESAILSGESYLKSIIKMTMGDKGLLPDNRAVLFCMASNLPYDKERLMQYGYLQNLQELGVNYVIFNKFLRCISKVILKQNKANKDEQITLFTFFTEDLYFEVNIWEECLQEMIQN